MGAFSIVLLGLGLLFSLGGGIMLLVAAFRQSIWWGLAYLLLPFASMVFVFVHWAEAKGGFFASLIGGAFLVGAIFADPSGNAYGLIGEKSDFTFESPEDTSQAAPEETAPGGAIASKDLNAQIQEKRDRIEQLQNEFGQAGTSLVAQYQALNAQRNALPKGDAAAEAQFNAANAAYAAQNAAQKKRQQELAELQQSLDDFLALRTKK